MQVMCLNAWGGTLHHLLLPYLTAQAPDILCLQEVVHSPQSRKSALEYRDGAHILPQQANLLRDVSAALPDHVTVFCPAAQGVLWDGDVSVPSQWGLATFVHRRLTVIGQVQGFVHKDYGADGFGEHPRSRSAHGVRVYDDQAKRVVSVTQMHGLRDLRGKMDTSERHAQALRLIAMSHQLSQPGDTRILCGDFNVEPDSETLRLIAEDGLTELVTQRGFDGTRTRHYEKPGRFADYMAIDRPEAVISFDVIHDPEVSDHCPLVLHI